MTSSVLSDGTIRRLVAEGRIKIDPWDPQMVQPASIDLKLGGSFRVFHNHKIKAIDLAAPPSDLTEHVRVDQGDEFVIHPTEFVLGRTTEVVELPDDVVARIEGKALALDTPVPTPAGWTTMGELAVGDEVFDAWGMPTDVVAATPVLHDRECREVLFSDGTIIVADVNHLWESWTKRARAKQRPRGDPHDSGDRANTQGRPPGIQPPRRPMRPGPLPRTGSPGRPLCVRCLDR